MRSPAIDARLLVEAAAGVSRAEILADPHRLLDCSHAQTLERYLERRASREPISQILGRSGFWKVVLGVNGKVLTPRPETEGLVEVALGAFDHQQPFEFVDLGVGSGAVMLAILAERPLARALGVDSSEDALAVARENAANLGLGGRAALLRGDWARGLGDATFDLALANPPYIPTADIAKLEPEVRDFEPRMALDGGVDGLDAFRVLAPEMLRLLRTGGVFAVEIGPGQKDPVAELFRQAGAGDVRVLDDLAGRARVVTGVKKGLGQ